MPGNGQINKYCQGQGSWGPNNLCPGLSDKASQQRGTVARALLDEYRSLVQGKNGTCLVKPQSCPRADEFVSSCHRPVFSSVKQKDKCLSKDRMWISYTLENKSCCYQFTDEKAEAQQSQDFPRALTEAGEFLRAERTNLGA